MKQLDLRTRLLMAFGFVAALQVLVAFVVVSVTRDHIVDQIDDRLANAVPLQRGPGLDPRFPGPPPGGENARPERLGDIYEGVLNTDGSLRTIFAPNTTGVEVPPPAMTLSRAVEGSGLPMTVASDGGDFRYRLTALPIEGDYFVTAIPLDGVDATMSRLRTVVWTTVALLTLALALVTWWMLRLGIAPIKRMTRTAEAIADGDLSERISDIDQGTESGQLGHALNTMLGQIEASMDERTRAEDKLRQFVADASHELRTPVATIRGYAELYQAGGLAAPVELDDAMRRTAQESQRMSRLITDMLNLAKLDREPTVTTLPVNLTELVRDAVADAAAAHPERSVIVNSGNGAAIVDGDEDLLRQVLANLVGNAIVHTDPATNVSVSVHRVQGDAVVHVRDNGDGMTAAVVAQITERFYRADPSRSRHQGGSGLGLAIAEAAVNAHGGTLAISSAPGSGTTATITIPLAHRPLDR